MSRVVFPLALVTTLSTFVLLLVGGTVNPTGSSLACPDWPTCYGSFFPAMKDGVQYEHTHRVVATFVGLLTVLLGIAMWRLRPVSRANRILAVSAVVAVSLQGLLGGITVLLRLPLAVSAGHLALSMLFFCLMLYLTFRFRPGARFSTPEPAPARARWLAALATVGVYLQILLGALVRHTHSGRACNDDFPWCLGSVWPDWGPAQLHMLHRYVGTALVLLVVGAAWSSWVQARKSSNRTALWLAAAAPGIVSLQFVLGWLTVISGIGLVEVTAHLGFGALLLADLFYLTLALGVRESAAHEAAPAREAAPLQPKGALS